MNPSGKSDAAELSGAPGQVHRGALVRRRAALLVLKLAITTFAFWFLLRNVPLSELVRAAGEISPKILAIACAIQLSGLGLGALRWRMLLKAYGASRLPALGPLSRIYLIGAFYNTYLPGAVSGDLVRGVISRQAFASDGTTRGVAVVFIDRLLGLSGLLILSIFSVSLFAADRFGPQVLALGGILLSSVLAAILALGSGPALASSFSRLLPKRPAAMLEGLAARLPRLAYRPAFGVALLFGTLSHVLVALCGHVLVGAAAPELPLTDSFLAMPLSGAAAYFPLTIAGAGARDLAMVQLYSSLGHARSAALAGSFAFLLTSLLTSGLGGILQLFFPLELAEPSRDTQRHA